MYICEDRVQIAVASYTGKGSVVLPIFYCANILAAMLPLWAIHWQEKGS